MIPLELENRDDRSPAAQKDELLLFSCVRNERKLLPYFLGYYRSLGIDRFYFVDNASSDGTPELLLAQPDAHVFSTLASYRDSRCGVDWLNLLLDRYGVGHWAVIADADELLVYPECERFGLRALARHLDGRGEQALMTFLLDMYGSGPIASTDCRPGEPFVDRCPFFDSDTYQLPAEGPFPHVPVRGGARQRLFFQRKDLRGQPPFLPKVPLVRWRSGLAFEASTHRLGSVRMAKTTGTLLHFKLFADFAIRVAEEIRRKEHWDLAAQYEAYGLTLEESPDLDPMYEGSLRYRGSRQLEALNLLRRSEDYPSPL